MGNFARRMCSVLKGISELRFVNTLRTRTSLTQYCVTESQSNIWCITNISWNIVADFSESNFSTVKKAVFRSQSQNVKRKWENKPLFFKCLVLKVRASHIHTPNAERQRHILHYVLFVVYDVRCLHIHLC
jgi:hypothetical protein